MDILLDFLPKGEWVPLKLRALYERHGYDKYKMGKFEPYDIYVENKQFLKSEGIITFTDAAGRLMALKPDVTISIVKNVSPDADSQKLYYNDNVFRLEHHGGECREISQVGLEYIGADRVYAEAEVVSLAIESLAIISESYMLDISHMGYISGLLSALDLSDEQGGMLLPMLRQKNAGGIVKLAAEYGIDECKTKALLGIAGICGELAAGIREAESYVLCEEMASALEELKELSAVLSAAGQTENVRLDFSVINDLDYYNGIVFRGYVREAARAVLAGGRYDNLLRRFGKPQPALGFALYLSELDRAFHRVKEFDVDVLLIYGDVSSAKVAVGMRRLIDDGVSVRAERSLPQGLKAKQVLRLTESGEVTDYA